MGGLPPYLTGKFFFLIFRGGRQEALRVFWPAEVLQPRERQREWPANLERVLFLRIRYAAIIGKSDKMPEWAANRRQKN